MPRGFSKRTRSPSGGLICQECGAEKAKVVYGSTSLMRELTGHPHANAYLCDKCYERMIHGRVTDKPAEVEVSEDGIVAQIFDSVWGNV